VPLPPLLSSWPPAVRFVLVVVLPCGFGALCGVLLGHSEAAYLIVSILAIAGGFNAGLEHPDGRAGALRGVAGGTQFGAFILIAHEIEGSSAKADLPHPAILLVVVTAGLGALLGYFGGRTRAGRTRAAAADL
jgi:hypothetical protein